jgi:hypothetical protein
MHFRQSFNTKPVNLVSNSISCDDEELSGKKIPQSLRQCSFMFFGLPDPDPIPVVRGKDWIKSAKIVRKTLISTVFFYFCMTFIFEE